MFLVIWFSERINPGMLGVSERGNKEVWVDNQCIVLIVIDVGTIISCTTLPIGRQHSALELDKTVSVMASLPLLS